jgi:hypothetical protein
LVEEMAFRTGQASRSAVASSSNQRIPSSPFPAEFDTLWALHFNRGRSSLHPAKPLLEVGSRLVIDDPGIWPALVDVYSQDSATPDGVLDLEYIREQCEAALEGMEMLVEKMRERVEGWETLVVDVPGQVRMALEHFGTLNVRYGVLKGRAENMRRVAALMRR